MLGESVRHDCDIEQKKPAGEGGLSVGVERRSLRGLRSAHHKQVVENRKRHFLGCAFIDADFLGGDPKTRAPIVTASVAANVPAVAIYKFPRVGHKCLLFVWRQ